MKRQTPTTSNAIKTTRSLSTGMINTKKKLSNASAAPLTTYQSAGFISKSHLFTAPLATFCLYLIVHYISFFDLNKRVYNHVPGECGFIGGLDDGATDMAYYNNETLIISTGSDLNNATNATKGGLSILPVNDHMATALKFVGKSPTTFNPYGISVYQKTIMVVNNRRGAMDKDSVEILEIKDGNLRRKRKPIVNKLFTSLTSIVALSKKEFYVVNQYLYRKPFLQHLELAGHFKTGSVFYFDGKNVQTVISRLLQPNGIAKDGNKLYVSLFGANVVNVYDITNLKSPVKIDEIRLQSAPLFISREPQSSALTISVATLKLRYLAYQSSPHEYLAPSQVIRTKKNKDGKWRITQYYCNDGATIRGVQSSIRLPNNKIALGNVNKGLLRCKLTAV